METAEVLMVDILTVCRICLQDSELYVVSIYEGDSGSENGISLREKIEDCSGIKLENSPDLPKHICLKCRAFLKLAYKFRQICRRSDAFLREFVSKELQTEDEQILALKQDTRPQPRAVETHYQQAELLQTDIWPNQSSVVAVATTETECDTDIGLPAADEAVANDASDIEEPTEEINTAQTNHLTRMRKLHICDICGNSCPRKSSLIAHLRRHRNERPFECEICKKAFHVNFQLIRHMRQHTGERPYSCQYCQRSFSDRTAQVKHERTHRNERPYSCKTCHKTFTYASVLKVHYKTHTGEKPHSCKLCNKSFARSHNLLAHLQTQQHHNDPRQAAYIKQLRGKATDNQ